MSPLLTLYAAHWFPFAFNSIELLLAYDQLFSDNIVRSLWVSKGEYRMGNCLVGEASVYRLDPSGSDNGVGLERVGGLDLSHVIRIASFE